MRRRIVVSSVAVLLSLIGGAIALQPRPTSPAAVTATEAAPPARTEAALAACELSRGADEAAAVIPPPAPSTPSMPASASSAALAAEIGQVLPGAVHPGDWRRFTPDEIVVAVGPNAPATFKRIKVKEGNDRVTWIGENGQGSLVAVAARDFWVATIAMTNGTEYRISISDRITVAEASTNLESCGTNLEMITASQKPEMQGDLLSVAKPDASGISTIDVVFFFDETAGRLTGFEEMKSYTISMVEQSNLDLTRSGITNVQWNFVGLHAFPAYDDKNDRSMSTDLAVITGTQTEIGKWMSGIVEAEAADKVVLFVGKARDFAGLAWTPGWQSVVLWGMTHMTLAHEMSHNLDCQHDRVTEGAKDGDGRYNYGHRFRTAEHGDTGTIMSYAGYRIPYFSNPDIVVEGVAMGVADGQPKAADNAKTIRSRAANMASHRTPVPVAITAQPAAYRTVQAGGAVTLSVQATGKPVKYQWRKGGVAIAGATGASFALTDAKSENGGMYDCVVYNSASSATSTGVNLVVRSSQPSNSRLVNISTRSTVGTGDNVQIAGFVIGGLIPKQVLIRANGPALTALGLGGALADPVLELHSRTATLETNDDWSADATKANQIQGVAAKVGAQAWAAGSKDAAILTTLMPGAYSALCSGRNGGTGISLIEVYEVDSGDAKLVNISSRTEVGTGNNVQIAGFVITGLNPLQVLVRASGPDLTKFGVSGVLANPVIELHDQKTSATLQTNDDWSTDAVTTAELEDAAALVGAQPLTRGSKDAAMLLTLNPGIYSIVVKGRNETTGIALVEVYVVP